MTAVQISNEKWLAERRKGIGGSDVAAVLGLSPWRTPLQVFFAKTGRPDPYEDTSDRKLELMHFGNVLEDIVSKEFQARLGLKVQRVNFPITAGKNEWMRANIDRAVINPALSGTVRLTDDKNRERFNGMALTTDTILECKTANQYAAGEWGPSQEDEIRAGMIVTEHQIPLYYETQVQWYLGLTKARLCYVAVLIGGNELRVYAVERDDKAFELIKQKCQAFWEDCVLAGKEPEAVDIKDVLRLYGRDDGEMVEASNEMAADIGEYRTLAAEINSQKAKLDEIKLRLVKAVGPAAGVTIGGEKAFTYKAQTRTAVDTALLKKTHPDIWKECLKTSEPTRSFRIS